MNNRKVVIAHSIRVQRQPLYEQIANQIEQMIAAKQVQPGDQLPPERTLAETLGVSRPTIREATRILRDRGLVELRAGSGTFVAAVSPNMLGTPVVRLFESADRPYLELQEIREMLEPSIAALAARNARSKNIAQLEHSIQEMEEWIDQPERYSQADLAFHIGLVEATQNGMLLALLNPILDILFGGIFKLTAGTMHLHPPLGPTHHREILRHVRDGRADDASAAMRMHLADSTLNLMYVLAHPSQTAADGLPGSNGDVRQA